MKAIEQEKQKGTIGGREKYFLFKKFNSKQCLRATRGRELQLK